MNATGTSTAVSTNAVRRAGCWFTTAQKSCCVASSETWRMAARHSAGDMFSGRSFSSASSTMPSRRSPSRRWARCTTFAKARQSRRFQTQCWHQFTANQAAPPAPARSSVERTSLGVSPTRSQRKARAKDPAREATPPHTARVVSVRHNARSSAVNCARSDSGSEIRGSGAMGRRGNCNTGARCHNPQVPGDGCCSGNVQYWFSTSINCRSRP